MKLKVLNFIEKIIFNIKKITLKKRIIHIICIDYKAILSAKIQNSLPNYGNIRFHFVFLLFVANEYCVIQNLTLTHSKLKMGD